jgi:hypothetical protein
MFSPEKDDSKVSRACDGKPDLLWPADLGSLAGRLACHKVACLP